MQSIMFNLRGSGFQLLLAVLLMVPSPWIVALSQQPSAATVAALDPSVTAGVGASLDFVEYEAEKSITNGRIE
jgi:hypothetical protein